MDWHDRLASLGLCLSCGSTSPVDLEVLTGYCTRPSMFGAIPLHMLRPCSDCRSPVDVNLMCIQQKEGAKQSDYTI
ncbi:hypothetical protein PAXRUDRAFT_821875 [Paxillus rubicundulus Ve08.2h10]|uniref:Uncharacterized protein n=1 Tax=Paxillus rubicundulus Ve08.2h10 TaxID=930991 RepID=A0A0D0DN29_9AGAM|nr:hypothetical protein PAXRUDRAFT_821875 [Paxillus rubicundulus Ve08.2h10]